MKHYKRRLTQVIAAILYNCNFKGFAQGTIYQGPVKNICVPGLNCYSCPGAVAACPIGSLQSALATRRNFPFYILGLLLLMGVLFGRFICGFLCPCGLIQDLLYKIPTRKAKKNSFTRKLSYLKYIILIVCVIIVPLTLSYPGFCKFICPAGTLEGGLPLAATNPMIRTMLGALFGWKLIIAIVLVISAIFVFRSFCRFICPLGAFYSLFNSLSVTRMEVDPETCTNCGACEKFCKMDIQKINDRECIQCGECQHICPHHAIKRHIHH